jgi:hypothetical protein
MSAAVHPLTEEGAPRLNQRLACGVVHVLAVVEIHNDRFHTLQNDAGAAMAECAEHLVGVLALVPATEELTGGIGVP